MPISSSLSAYLGSTREQIRDLSYLIAATISLFVMVATPRVTAGQTADTVVATIDGEPITQEQVDFLIASQLLPLEQQIYALRSASLQNLMGRRILENEARRKGITPDQLKQEMMSGDVTISAEQVEKLYQQNATAFGMMSKDEVIEKLRMDLEAQARVKRFREQLAKLKEKARVDVFLVGPKVQLTSPSDSFASTGQPDARVVLTEFSDFQCPYCKAAQSVIHRVLKEYPKDVRLEFRNLPLEMHPFASLAARGSYCAGKQNKFWVYHDALFSLGGFDSDAVEKVAKDVSLDTGKFKTCLASVEAQHSVAADVNEAVRLGINSTPTLLINGRQFRGSIQFEDLKEQIERELTVVGLTPQPRPLTAKERK